jgi:hypothetical protein
MITPNGVTLKGVMDFTRIDSLFEPLQKPVKTDHKYNKIIELRGLDEQLNHRITRIRRIRFLPAEIYSFNNSLNPINPINSMILK